jgi:3-hydroxyisobutyrate dehydrogenase-like beta-hydroxyacid dehydrogenase
MASAATDSIGLVGLGTMGGAIATRLLAQGIPLTVFDVDASAIDRLRANSGKAVQTAASLQDLARRCSIVLCCLAHPDILRKVVAGTDGLRTGLSRGSIVIDLSTSGPQAVRDCAAVLERTGAQMVDATIGRGPAAALKGQLVLMLGGTPAALDRIEPIIRLLAAKIVRCGPLGSAQVLKLANNLVACANLAVIAEAYRFVRQQGVDPALLIEIMQGTYADSFQLQNSVVTKAMAGDFDIVFRLELAAKDVRLIAEAIRDGGADSSISQATLDWYDAAVRAGHGAVDWSAVMLVADPALQSAATAQ